ncbi:hypothetical protein CQW23_01272 [Capsicum baccatum]|uniref:Non-structural maintenance of chromosomes element 4 n=1 Tax=Capsicum baccatum TaxID=33114 RepID=A0A2G2XN82_CAPBA|nr:hypothetical protein CQW23_01272 [Capsicum baccatum]
MLKVRFFGLLGNKNMPIKKPREQVADAEALFDLARTLVTSVRSHILMLDFDAEEITDTDKNISTMFQILKKEKRVKLENLVLNRKCFAQTIENLFALSFLVKDGRAVILVVENGSHFLSPRNGPAARLVMSGEVKYNHFVFRLDFADWELMKKVVPEGDELMPNRVIMASPVFTEANKPDKTH